MLLKSYSRKLFPVLYGKLGTMKMNHKLSLFKKQYPNTKIFIKPESKIYSQENQDYIVYNNFFRNKTDGFFCDVGGNHPQNINNTRYFEETGWTGCVFEPLPHMQKLWEQHRKAKFFPFAASDHQGTVTFSMVKNVTGWEDMLSYVKEDIDITKTQGCETEDITVQTIRLKDVFDEENITDIDYMSIDVEGHEMSVIKGIDFKKVRINVLTIENNNSPHIIHGNDEIRKLMFDNDYVLWGRIPKLDDIFVHKDFLLSQK